MNSTIPIQQNINTCPHGVNPSTCPICNKQHGSSAIMKNQHKEEWSYQKCVLAWEQIKTAKYRRQTAQTFFENRFQNGLKQNNMVSTLNRITQFINNIGIQQFYKPFNDFILNNTFNVTILKYLEKTTNVIQQTSDKILAILGELKNFWDRKIIDNLIKNAKKILFFFLSGIEDENYKNDDTLAIFKWRELRRNKKYINDTNSNNK